MKKLFGTDGVRGVANVYPMTTEMAMQIGRAAAHIFKKDGDTRRHRIVIGKDTRLSGYMIENALVAGICSMGVDVLLVGPLPTPGIANITSSMRADAGVVISASHNPFQDNGIKFFSREGVKLPDAMELAIEELIFSKNIDSFRPTATEVGKAYRIDDAAGRYIVFLKNAFSQGAGPGRDEDCPGLCQWCRLQGCSCGVAGTGRRSDFSRHQTERYEHQCRLRFAVPRGYQRGSAGPTARISELPLMVMRTGSFLWMNSATRSTVTISWPSAPRTC